MAIERPLALRGNPIYGLMRTEQLKRTGLYRNTSGPDHRVLLELALMGHIAHIPEALYCSRQHRPAGGDPIGDVERYFDRLDPSNSRRRLLLSYIPMAWNSLAIVARSQFNPAQKLWLSGVVLCSFLKTQWKSIVYYDLVCGSARILFGRAFARSLGRILKRS